MRIYNDSGSLVIANDLGQIISIFGSGEMALQPIADYVTITDLNQQRVIVRELFSNIYDFAGVPYGANIQATCVELAKVINAINGVVGGVVVNYEFFADLPPVGELERLYYVYGDVPQALYAWNGVAYVSIGGGALPLLPIFLDETSTITDFAAGNTYYYIGKAPITYDYDLEPYPLPVPISGFNFVNLSVFDVTFNSDGGNTNYVLNPLQSLKDIQVTDNGGVWRALASEYFDNIYDLQQVTNKGAITTNAIFIRNNPDNYRTRYSILGQGIQRDDLGFNLNYYDTGITKTATGSKTWQLQMPDLATNANSSNFLVQFRPNVSGTVAYLNDISSGSSSWLNPVIDIQNTPPITPATGDRYIVGTAPTGAWVGNANNIAEWNGTIWVYTTPISGNVVVVRAISPPNNIYQFNGTTWIVGVSNPFLQGGNNFGANGVLGVTSNHNLSFITNNTERLRITNAGLLTQFIAGTGATVLNFQMFDNSTSSVRMQHNKQFGLTVFGTGSTTIGNEGTQNAGQFTIISGTGGVGALMFGNINTGNIWSGFKYYGSGANLNTVSFTSWLTSAYADYVRFLSNGQVIIATNTNPVASAQLQIDSTTRGFLMPRMTLAQRTAIASPATHLLVSQTDGFAGQYTRKASTWALLQDSEYSHVRIKTITATETPALTDNIILVNAVGGAITVNLPSAASAYDSNLLVGKTYVIKKIDATANSVIIDGNGAETIDGNATITFNSQNERIRIVSNGSNWFII